MKLTITSLGTPKAVVTSYGEKHKNWLKAQEHGDKFLNFWVNGTTKDWKVGQEIEVEGVEERKYVGKDGVEKTSLEIKLPKLNGNSSPLLEKLLTGQQVMDAKINEILNIVTRLRDSAPEDGPSDLPF